MLYLYAQSLTLEHILGYFDSTTVLTEYGTLSKFNDKELDHEQKYFFTTVGEDVSGFLFGTNIFPLDATFSIFSNAFQVINNKGACFVTRILN